MKLSSLTKQLFLKCRSLVQFGNVWLVDGKPLKELDCGSMLKLIMSRQMGTPVQYVKSFALQKMP